MPALTAILLPPIASALFLGLHFPALPLFLRSQLRRHLSAELFHLENRAQLDVTFHVLIGTGAALDPLDRLVHRFHLPEPESGDKLLRLGEGAVDDDLFPAAKLKALALGTWVEPLAGKHYAGFHQLIVKLA